MLYTLLFTLEKENFPPRKKFFIFLNPKSGKCKTLHIFRDVIEPLFKDATIDYEVCTTGKSANVGCKCRV